MKVQILGIIALAAVFVLACSQAETPQVATDEEPMLKWTFLAGHPIGTSAAVDGDKLVVGADDGSLYALDAETGKRLWEFETGRQIRSTPVVADGVAYFGNHGGFVHAVKVETGEELWSFKASGSITGSLALVDGAVYFGTTWNDFFALETRTGNLNWQTDLKRDGRQVFNFTAPTVLGDMVFQVSTIVASSDSFFNALDRHTGEIVWSLAIEGWAFDPTVSGNTAFVSTTGFTADGWLYAIDLDTHQARWVHRTADRAQVRTSPAISEGIVLFGDGSGRLTALDSITGTEEWTFDLGSDFWTSLTVTDQLVYFVDVDGAIVAVDATEGTEQSRFQTVLGGSDPTDCNTPIVCGQSRSPVVHEGSVYVANPAGYLYALEHRISTKDVNQSNGP